MDGSAPGCAARAGPPAHGRGLHRGGLRPSATGRPAPLGRGLPRGPAHHPGQEIHPQPRPDRSPVGDGGPVAPAVHQLQPLAVGSGTARDRRPGGGPDAGGGLGDRYRGHPQARRTLGGRAPPVRAGGRPDRQLPAGHRVVPVLGGHECAGRLAAAAGRTLVRRRAVALPGPAAAVRGGRAGEPACARHGRRARRDRSHPARAGRRRPALHPGGGPPGGRTRRARPGLRGRAAPQPARSPRRARPVARHRTAPAAARRRVRRAGRARTAATGDLGGPGGRPGAPSRGPFRAGTAARTAPAGAHRATAGVPPADPVVGRRAPADPLLADRADGQTRRRGPLPGTALGAHAGLVEVPGAGLRAAGLRGPVLPGLAPPHDDGHRGVRPAPPRGCARGHRRARGHRGARGGRRPQAGVTGRGADGPVVAAGRRGVSRVRPEPGRAVPG
ncbi:hypothetical protein SGPA1_50869 [Streptomyces misionensis JCM 4497]